MLWQAHRSNQSFTDRKRSRLAVLGDRTTWFRTRLATPLERQHQLRRLNLECIGWPCNHACSTAASAAQPPCLPYRSPYTGEHGQREWNESLASVFRRHLRAPLLTIAKELPIKHQLCYQFQNSRQLGAFYWAVYRQRSFYFCGMYARFNAFVRRGVIVIEIQIVARR